MALTVIEWTRMIGKMAVEAEVSTVTALLATEAEDLETAEIEVEETATEVAATDEASPLFNLIPSPARLPLQATTINSGSSHQQMNPSTSSVHTGISIRF